MGDFDHHDSRSASVAFGRRLRELRHARNVSQDELSARTDVHPTAIGRLERGARDPRLTTILRLADGLEVEPGELVDGLREPCLAGGAPREG